MSAAHFIDSIVRSVKIYGLQAILVIVVGPLTEVTLPVDSLTKKVKGFAFITYMMPEHAVKAYSTLDGKVFQVATTGHFDFVGLFLCHR